MDGIPMSSERRRQRKRGKVKAMKSQINEDRLMSSSPYANSNKSPNSNLVRTPGKNHSKSSAAKSDHVDPEDENPQSPIEVRLKQGKRDRKGIQGTSDISSSIPLNSTPRLAYHNASSPMLPHAEATPRSNKKRNRRQKQKREEERSDLELLKSSSTGHVATFKALESIGSTKSAGSRYDLPKKRKSSDDFVGGQKAQRTLKSRRSEHQDIRGRTSDSPTRHYKALPPRSSKKKSRHRSQVTVSDLTQFNKASQNFKSAKIKHDQDLKANVAEHSHTASNHAPARQSMTSTDNLPRIPIPENTISEDSSSVLENNNNENDNDSSDRQLQRVKIESPEPSSNISKASQNFEAIQQEDMDPVSSEDNAEDSSDSAHTNESLEETANQRSGTLIAMEPQITIESQKQKSSKRKRSRKGESDTSQSSKRSRMEEVTVPAQPSLKEEVDRHSISSVDGSGSESPRTTNSESPIRKTTIPRRRKVSPENPQHKTMQPKSQTNGFKSAKFVVNSDSEAAAESTDSVEHADDQHSQSSADGATKKPLSVSREVSQDDTVQDDGSSPSSGSSEDDTAKKSTTVLEKKKSAVKQRKPHELPIVRTASKSDVSTVDAPSTGGKERKLVKNYMDGIRKMGQFDAQEQEKVKAFEMRYRTVHGLSEAEFLDKINRSAHNNKDLQAIWLELQDELPGRDRKSIQRHCRRKRPAAGTVTSVFTNVDDQQLMSLVAQYGTSWVKVGREMDRTADVVRDRYRNVLKDQATRSLLKWTDEDTEELKRAVGKTAAQALEKNPEIENPYDLLVWGSISEEMKGKRGRAQCSHKWKALRVKGEVSVVDEIEKAAERMNLRIDLSRIKRDDIDTQADLDSPDESNAEDSDDGNSVPATKGKTKLKDRLQSTTKKGNKGKQIA